MLKLDYGINHVDITKDYYNGYEGWLIDLDNGKSAFLRLENGEWVQRLNDELSVKDIKNITDAMQECALI